MRNYENDILQNNIAELTAPKFSLCNFANYIGSPGPRSSISDFIEKKTTRVGIVEVSMSTFPFIQNQKKVPAMFKLTTGDLNYLGNGKTMPR
jgi:hypothetical protein